MNGIVSAVQGRVTRDPEPKYTSQGTAMLVLNVAVHDDKRAEDGPTEWARITLWQGLAEQLQGVVAKGAEVYAEGRLRVRTYEKQDGSQGVSVDLSAWKCEVLGAIGRQRPKRQQEHGAEPVPGQGRMPAMVAAVGAGRRMLDDDDWGAE